MRYHVHCNRAGCPQRGLHIFSSQRMALAFLWGLGLIPEYPCHAMRRQHEVKR